ncbi:beta-lactamase family protein [Cellulomonas sp. DKR-3]|uniref:Beta-lactamase family protein n=1 Tax=Cellulomonas fulva TaxID=2835530 RepID=A0ABS5TUZ8_9CELL|nr:serine hydrolase domain-containing protein [Cellulomonas fulva]MBT0992963.1 beta-lactamase family protein [Cellulomonas fulva]
MDEREHLAAALAQHPTVPGVSVAVMRGGAATWAGAAGVSDASTGRALSAEQPLHACSMTKLVTATVVLALTERGLVDLDADVAATHDVPLTRAASAGDRPVTLRHLLAHVAGIVDADGSFEPVARGDGTPDLADLLRGRTSAHAGPVTVAATPGTRFAYSDGGYAVVEHVIEVATGRPYDDVARELVLDPLGLARAVLRRRTADAPAAATGHGPAGRPVEDGWALYPALGGAGLWCTPRDVAVLLSDLRRSWTEDGGRLLTAATARQILDGAEAEPHAGLGLFLPAGDGRVVSTHGWGVGFQCAARLDVESGDGVVVMTNCDPGRPQPESVVGALLQTLGPTTV